MSIIFPPAILGPEMAADWWAPGIFWFSALENLHAHRNLILGCVCVCFFGGGGVSTSFIFISAGMFLISGSWSREAKPGGLETRWFPTFFGKGPDCVADPFGTVPCRCC